jgi:hypothetical protein
VVLTAFYSPESKITRGVGPVIELPTGGSNRGSEQWSVGPSFVILIQPDDWTLGLLMNNAWSVAGKSEQPICC